MREPLLRTPDEVAEDDYWTELYGEWDALDLTGVRAFFDGFDRPWWLVGGWALEAFTGAAREHEDIDVSILACDVPALRAHVAGRHQLWNICNGALRPLTDRLPDLMEPDSQIWVRRDARTPWLIDLPVTPDVDGAWRNKRLPEQVAPVDEVTWRTDDGVRALNPEIVLLFKARLDRAKDRRDRDRALPLMTLEQRTWLRDAVRRLHPEHPWQDLLDD
jgi:hypothetical protein